MADCSGALWMLKDSNMCSGQIPGLQIRTSYDVLFLFQDTYKWLMLLFLLPNGPSVTHHLGVTHSTLFILEHIRQESFSYMSRFPWGTYVSRRMLKHTLAPGWNFSNVWNVIYSLVKALAVELRVYLWVSESLTQIVNSFLFPLCFCFVVKKH